MAITVDVQPAYATSSTQAAVTALFTPTAGSLLVALVGIGNGTGTAGAGSSAITDTGSHSWTLLKREANSGNATAEIWVADNASTSAITVTATSQITGQLSVGLQVISYLGAAVKASQTGATAVAAASTVSITTTQTGSQVVGAFGDISPETLTANANSTILGQFSGSTSGDTEGSFKATSLTGTPGATTFGFTNTTAASMAIVGAEILAAASGGGSTAAGNSFAGSWGFGYAPGINGGLLEQIQPNFWQQNRPAPVVAPNLTTQNLQILVPAYVAAGDVELTNITNASPPVGAVIVNVNSGDSPIGATLLAQVDSFRALGIKVFWYIYAPYTPSFRSLSAVQTALNNGLVTGDGIIHFDGVFIDEYARDAGSSPGLLDYITYYTTIRSLIRDTANGVVPQSGGTVLAMANPGTAIDDRYVSQNVADIFNTFEGAVQTYNNSWLGGNVFNLGSGLYRLGQDFPASTFCHLITNVSPTTDPSGMRATIDTAYARWIGWTYVTDQPLSPNPWINTPAWGFSAETSYAASEPNFNGSFPGVWPGTYAPGWPGPELDLLIPNFWMSGSTTPSTITSVSDIDSSTGSETQSLVTAITDTDSSTGNDVLVSVGISNNDLISGSENQVVGIANVDSSTTTDLTFTIGISNSDSSFLSEAQNLAVTLSNVDSSITTETANSPVVAVSSTDSCLVTDAQNPPVIAESSSDSSVTTDISNSPSVAVSNSDSIMETDLANYPSVSISSTDSCLTTDIQNYPVVGVLGVDSGTTTDLANSPVVSLSDVDNSLGSESSSLSISISNTDSSVVSEAQSTADYVSSIDNIVGIDSGSASVVIIIYKLVVSPNPFPVGILGNLNVTDDAPWLTLGPNVTSISSSDSITGTDVVVSANAVLTGTDSSLEAETNIVSITNVDSSATSESSTLAITLGGNDLSVEAEGTSLIGVISSDSVLLTDSVTSSIVSISNSDFCTTFDPATLLANVAGTDSAAESENQSVSMAYQKSDGDSSIGTDVTQSPLVNIQNLEISTGSESSEIFVSSSDSFLGGEFAQLGLFFTDVDNSRVSENQNVLTSISNTDSSIMSENQIPTLFFPSTDAITGTDAFVGIADAVGSVDDVQGAESSSIFPQYFVVDFIQAIETLSLVIQVSDNDIFRGTDSQPIPVQDIDSCLGTDSFTIMHNIRDQDECLLIAENTSFLIGSQLVIEWAIFAHLNQVIFAQPLNQ